MPDISIKPADKGFTLVELSIVLVIISLLIGGILLGNDLIRASEIRSIISDRDKLQTAFVTFKLKYNCLPGDCPNASQFLSGAYDGDGNDAVGFFYSGNYELHYAIFHIHQAGLMAMDIVTPYDLFTHTLNSNPGMVPGFNIPSSKYPMAGYYIGYSPLSAGWCSATTVAGSNSSPAQCNKHSIFVNGGYANGGSTYTIGNSRNAYPFPCYETSRIDAKFDDGMPFTGQMVLPGHNNGSAGCASGNWPSGVYNGSSTGSNFAFIIR